MMQNGRGPEDDAARAAPGRPIFGGLCFLCSHNVAPGRIRHLDYGKVTFAAWSPDGSAAGTPRRLAADLMAKIQAGRGGLGRKIPDAFLDHMFELTDRMTPYATSM